MTKLLKGNSQIKVTDMGENNTMQSLEIHTGFLMPKDGPMLDNYIADARRVIDDASKDLNAIGMNIMIGALLHLHLVEGYRGKHA